MRLNTTSASVHLDWLTAASGSNIPHGIAMPKPNYAFEKRQRELEKKRKKAEKADRRAQQSPNNAPPPAEEPVVTPKE
jgi:hypothetical protein